jgi:hypothetical protein
MPENEHGIIPTDFVLITIGCSIFLARIARRAGRIGGF